MKVYMTIFTVGCGEREIWTNGQPTSSGTSQSSNQRSENPKIKGCNKVTGSASCWQMKPSLKMVLDAVSKSDGTLLFSWFHQLLKIPNTTGWNVGPNHNRAFTSLIISSIHSDKDLKSFHNIWQYKPPILSPGLVYFGTPQHNLPVWCPYQTDSVDS